ncbi:MAG TPA: hypothetical protein PKW37_10110 [Salinivirgaceae bacterium]|nr:hypothetical protein [Salinivirgaceae bacterium]
MSYLRNISLVECPVSLIITDSGTPDLRRFVLKQAQVQVRWLSFITGPNSH